MKTSPVTGTDAGREGRTITITGAVANFFLIVVKFTAGILGNSQALIADAIHSISDLFTDAVVLMGLWVGRKPPDDTHHFGHGRIETTASAIVGISLISAAVFIGYQATMDVYHHTEHHPTWIALIGASLSIVVKEILYQYTVIVGKKIKSQVVIANAWHHRSDALSSVAVLFGVGGALINPGWHILDAYAALVVSFFIIKVGLDVLWKSMREMTDTAPRAEVVEQIRDCIGSVAGVKGLHDLKVRTIAGIYHIQVHIEVDKALSISEGHLIINEARSILRKTLEDVGEITVHLDPA